MPLKILAVLCVYSGWGMEKYQIFTKSLSFIMTDSQAAMLQLK